MLWLLAKILMCNFYPARLGFRSGAGGRREPNNLALLDFFASRHQVAYPDRLGPQCVAWHCFVWSHRSTELEQNDRKMPVIIVRRIAETIALVIFEDTSGLNPENPSMGPQAKFNNGVKRRSDLP